MDRHHAARGRTGEDPRVTARLALCRPRGADDPCRLRHDAVAGGLPAADVGIDGQVARPRIFAATLMPLGNLAANASARPGVACIESYGAGGWLLWGTLLVAATASPVVGAIALISGRPSPSFLELLGPEGYRTESAPEIMHGLVWIATIVIGTATALGLIFDPRFIDFPFATLTMAAVPFAAVTLLNPTTKENRPLAESMFAGVFLAAAVYVGINEGPANWQSLWTCAAYLLLALTLWRVRA